MVQSSVYESSSHRARKTAWNSPSPYVPCHFTAGTALAALREIGKEGDDGWIGVLSLSQRA